MTTQNLDIKYSRKHLQKIVDSLLCTVQTQQKQIDDLQKWVKKQKKKLNIVYWLNKEYPTATPFQQWYKSIQIGRRQLEYLFQHGHAEGIYYILQENLGPESELTIPIRCFYQKPRTYYVFRENKQWGIITKDEFNSMLSYIRIQLICEFKQWQDENKDVIHDPKQNNKFLEYVKKVMDGDSTNTLIKKKIFTYLKFNLKNIIHYSFVF